MRRPLRILFPGLMVVTLLAAASLITISAASAAPIAGAPTTYCGDPTTDPSEDTGAGTMIQCHTVVANTITAIDPVTGNPSGHSVITVTECRGPASGRLDPSFLTCSTDQQNLAMLVTRVYQCNGVGYGGGNVLDCTVAVTNDFVGVTPQVFSVATINQCNGSAPVTTGCLPFPATALSAAITQCNGSSYGGTQEDFNCIASGNSSATLPFTVNQCNDSNYGGGSWLNCSTSLTNTNLAAPPPPPPSPTPTPTPTPPSRATATPAPTSTAAPTAGPTSIPISTVAPTATPASPPPAAAQPVPTPPAPTIPLMVTPVTPRPTLPPTSTVGGDTGQPGGMTLLVLAGLSFLVALSLLATARRRASPARVPGADTLR